MALGRPSSFSDAITEDICERIAQGESLRSICELEGMPDGRTVRRWLREHDDFRLQYAQACEERAHHYNEIIVETATADPAHNMNGVDPGDVAHRRLKVDALKWVASKLHPKVYGDKQEVEHSGSIDLAVALTDRLAKARQRAAKT